MSNVFAEWMENKMPMTQARMMILKSARLFPPAAMVVQRRFNFGFEAASEKRNINWLVEKGYLRPNAHGDWYLTDKAETLLAGEGWDE